MQTADMALAAAEATGEAARARDALVMVKGLNLVTEEDFTFAADLVKLAHDNIKRLDKRRTAITKPILDAKRAVDGLFKPALDVLNEIKAVLEGKIGAHVRAQQEAQVLAMNTQAAAFAAGQTPTEPIPEVPEAKGVSVKSRWVADVVDPEAVPRELCSPDPEKIARAIWYADTPHTPPRPIPGLTFRLETDVTVRTRNQ
jgi:hypothetical protein